MSVLDQIESIIKNKVKNEKGEEIIDLTFSNYKEKCGKPTPLGVGWIACF